MSVAAFVAAIVVLDLVVTLAALRIVAEHERLVVHRLGRFHRVLGPGLAVIVPGVDKAQRIDLHRAVPEWRALSPEALQLRVEELAASGQLSHA